MGNGLTMTKSSFSDEIVEAKPQPFIPPEIEWPELEIARKTFPSLTIEDQKTWLAYDHVHHKAGFEHGYFTFRLTSNKYGPSIERHLELGRTHALMCVMDKKRPGESGEKLQHLFFVDIRKAWFYRRFAITMVNRRDGTPYLFYDPLIPGTERVYERLRI